MIKSCPVWNLQNFRCSHFECQTFLREILKLQLCSDILGKPVVLQNILPCSFQIRIRRQNIMNTVTIITAIPTALYCERGKNVTELNWCPIISHHSGNILTDTTTSFCFRNPECMVNNICKGLNSDLERASLQYVS